MNDAVGILNLIHEWCSQHSKTHSWQRAESAFSASFMNDARLNQHSRLQSWMVLGWISILSLIHERRSAESAFSASVINDAGLNRHPQLHSCMIQGWIGMFGIIHKLRHSTYRSQSLCSRSNGVCSLKPGCVVCMVGVLTDVSLRFG